MKLYDIIEQAIRNHVINLNINQSVTHDKVRNAIRWVMRENPDIFWFAHQYHYDEVGSIIHFQYPFSAERVKTIQQSINNVIENDFCIGYVKTLTKQKQIIYVYKWLVSYCNFNANSAYNQSVYSVFVRRNSVCTGYAKAAQYLFNLLGFESRLAFGRLHNDKEDGRHCWNLVKVDNEYYHFDACFGDSILDNVAIKSGVHELFKIDGINYNFLCISTDEILRTRSIEDITTLPECPISWSGELIISLVRTEIKKRDDIKGCLLSHIGSSADIYLCSKNKKTVLKVFRPNSKTTSLEEFHYMQKLKGCHHLLQCNDVYTDITQNIVAIEQSTPVVDLLCSHYYELSLKGVIKMATDVALAWKECQERGVLYRDIHVCNIYRSNDGTFKLGDFGSCTNDFGIKETVGNQWFMAPETLVSGIFTESSAVYSISMVMYFILNKLRPVFWEFGCEDEALRKRMDRCELPTPAGCINIPAHIKTKLDNFFRSASASSQKERISSIEELIYELGNLTCYCGGRDYVVHNKGISLDLDLDAENNDRLDNRWNYIPSDARHRYAMGDAVEQMCTTAIPKYESCKNGHRYDVNIYGHKCPFCPSENDKTNIPGDCACFVSRSVDKVEKFARTMAAFNIDEDGDIVAGQKEINSCTMDNEDGFIPDIDTNIQDRRLLTYLPFCNEDSNKDDKNDHIKYTRDRYKELEIELSKAKKDYKQLEIDLINIGSTLITTCKQKEQSFFRFFSTLSSKNEYQTRTVAEIVEEKINRHGIGEPNWSKEEKKYIIIRKIKKETEKRIDELEKSLCELKDTTHEVYSSIFAPAEVKRKSQMQVQVYLHLFEETEFVKSLAKEPDKNAERRDYIPLSLKLRKGDKVDVEFNIYGETRLMSECKSIIWQGSFTKCSFDYFVPKDIDVDELSCMALLTVNNIPVGELRFITDIVPSPNNLNQEIISRKYNKIFISYAHQDESKVKFLAEGFKMMETDYFFDRHYLKTGDIFPQKIQDYISEADLFILCWSENASKSEYVQKERTQALGRAFPQVKPQQVAKLSIYPISIEPRAELPGDMKENYHFGVI